MNLSLNHLLLSLVLTPLFAVSTLLPLAQQPAAGITFQPKGRPQKTAGGASRGSCYSAKGVSTSQGKVFGQRFTALIPSTDMEFTTEAYPTVLVDYSQSETFDVEFTLWDQDGNGIYQTTIPLKAQLSGIINLKLPQAAGPLIVGKQYKWNVAIICDKYERQRDIIIKGVIQRIKPSLKVTSQLAIANPLQKAKIYAENGYWYESVSTLYEQRRLYPQNQQIAWEWKELLESVGLKELSQAPVVNCCQAKLAND